MEWLKSMLKDSNDGSVSSKRVIAFLAFIMCCIAFLVDLFSGRTVTPSLFDSMVYIVMAGMGLATTEKFAPTKDNQ